MSAYPPIVIVLAGPTAVGKTSMGIKLANVLGTEIINADSRQVYKYLDIGTAKPTREEQEEVKYHMIDVVTPDHYYSAADYGKDAQIILKKMIARGKIPIVEGGSGLYIRSLLEGFFEGPPANMELRNDLRLEAETYGWDRLYERIVNVDNKTAQRIHPNDHVRIIRALEVFILTGTPISELQERGKGGGESEYEIIYICLERDREELYTRIDERVDSMIEQGLENEVEMLLSRGYKEDLNSMQGLGYRHILLIRNGSCSYEQGLRAFKRDTRRYAKRQITWFGSIENAHWFNLSEKDGEEKLFDFVRNNVAYVLGKDGEFQ